MTVAEALKHAGIHLGVEVDIQWVHSADLEKGKGWDVIQNSDGIIVPGGFGSRGIEGKIQSIRYARENKDPLPWIMPWHAVDGCRICPVCISG